MSASMHVRTVVQDTDDNEAFGVTVSRDVDGPTKVIIRSIATGGTVAVMVVDGMTAMVLSQALSLAGTIEADQNTSGDKGGTFGRG